MQLRRLTAFFLFACIPSLFAQQPDDLGKKDAGKDGKKDDDGYAEIAVFARALQLIRQDYVDEKKVTYEQLTHAALRGMLESLDPHSQFMEPDDFKG